MRSIQICILILSGVALPLLRAQAAPPPEVSRGKGFPPRFHDPSTPVKDGDTWWIFATGNGLATRFSKDLKTWREGPPAFKTFPSWHREVVPSQRGHLWAPDLVCHQGRYRLYYSVSSFGSNISAIGLATSPTLDPASPRCQWRDEGIVIRSAREDSFNAIDPHVIIDDRGGHWLSFGSFWTGIQLLELNPQTGMAHPDRGKLRRLAWNDTIEAPAILKHGDYYHLFVNWGICCRGLQSTYEIRCGRSRAITGPYLDRAGRDLATGGGTLLFGSAGDLIGPGHASFLAEKSATRMFFHYYDGKRGGFATLSSRILKWTDDGWPEIGPADDPPKAP